MDNRPPHGSGIVIACLFSAGVWIAVGGLLAWLV